MIVALRRGIMEKPYEMHIKAILFYDEHARVFSR